MRNVDGAEKMADALRLVHHIEVMQMRTVGAAAENAAKHIDHDGEAAAFRAADRHERAGTTGRGVRGGSAVLIQCPALGNRLSQLLRQNELAQRHNARRHIQHDRKVVGRSRHGDGICAHVGLSAAEGRDLALEIGAGKSDHILRGSKPCIIGGGAEVVGAVHACKAAARLFCLGDAPLHRKFCRRRAQRVAGVHDQRGGRFPHDADVVFTRHHARVHALHINGQTAHTVGGHACQLRVDQRVSHRFRAAPLHTGGRQDRHAVAPQRRCFKPWHNLPLFRWFFDFPV